MFSKKHDQFLTSVLYAAGWNPNVDENNPGVSGKARAQSSFQLRGAWKSRNSYTEYLLFNIYYSIPAYVQSVNHLSDPLPLFLNWPEHLCSLCWTFFSSLPQLEVSSPPKSWATFFGWRHCLCSVVSWEEIWGRFVEFALQVLLLEVAYL